MSKSILVLPIIAYMISAGTWGLQDQLKQPFGEFTGKKGEAEAEAKRLNAEFDFKDGTLAGVLDAAGNVQLLVDMPDEELRELALALELANVDIAALSREQLLDALQGESVIVGESAGALSGPQTNTYIVNRERLVHDHQVYGMGDQVVIEDPASAQVLLDLGAILEVQA